MRGDLARTDDHEPGGTLLVQQIEVADRFRGLFVRVAQHGHEPLRKADVCGSFAISAKKDLGIGDQDADRWVLAAPQVARQRIWAIAQLFDGLMNPYLKFRADVGALFNTLRQ